MRRARNPVRDERSRVLEFRIFHHARRARVPGQRPSRPGPVEPVLGAASRPARPNPGSDSRRARLVGKSPHLAARSTSRLQAASQRTQELAWLLGSVDSTPAAAYSDLLGHLDAPFLWPQFTVWDPVSVCGLL